MMKKKVSYLTKTRSYQTVEAYIQNCFWIWVPPDLFCLIRKSDQNETRPTYFWKNANIYNKIWILSETAMCNRRARYKIKGKIASFLRHIFQTYRQRAGCIVLKRELNGKISVLLIQALNQTQKANSVYKLAGTPRSLRHYGSTSNFD